MADQPTRVCKTCGKTFTRQVGSAQTHAKFKRRRYCSRLCSQLRNGATLKERLEHFTQRDPDGCWYWTGGLTGDGYGQMYRGQGKGMISAHVAAFELRFGPIPRGMTVDHTCRVRHCVNPDHMQPVSNAENVRLGNVATLTHEDIPEILALIKQGESQAAIGKLYHVHQTTISRVARQVTWFDSGAPIPRKQRVIMGNIATARQRKREAVK